MLISVSLDLSLRKLQGLGKEEAWKRTELAVTAGTKQLCCEVAPCLIYGEGFEKGKFLACHAEREGNI